MNQSVLEDNLFFCIKVAKYDFLGGCKKLCLRVNQWAGINVSSKGIM